MKSTRLKISNVAPVVLHYRRSRCYLVYIRLTKDLKGSSDIQLRRDQFMCRDPL